MPGGAGHLGWNVWRDDADPHRYVLDELYVDTGAVAAHRATAHYRSYLSLIPELAERLAIVSSPALVE